MNELALKKIRRDVSRMLKDLRFNSSEGAYVEGELAAIEIVPKRKKGSTLCDLHFRIIPYHMERDAPTEILAGVREACLEAQFDPNPNVQFAARHYLASLKVTERVRPGDMEGLFVSLSAKSERGDELALEGSTDRDGEIWFLDVSLSGVCHLTMAESERLQPVVVEAGEESSPTFAYAAELPDEPPPRPVGRSRVFTLPDRPVIAVLEEIVGGEAMLTLETGAKELSGATVRFEWGKERGEVKLAPGETGGAWSGQCRLTRTFKELASAMPTFEIISPHKKSER